MSYCRSDGQTSDVYVYRSALSGVLRCACEDSGRFLDNKAMILHLIEHLRNGDRVPQSAFERLLDEIQEEAGQHYERTRYENTSWEERRE
jgi:hypothetical protein